jgi:hypothetical protein
MPSSGFAFAFTACTREAKVKAAIDARFTEDNMLII